MTTLFMSNPPPAGAMSLMPTPEDLLAEYARLAQRMRDIQREIQQEMVRAQLPSSMPRPRFKRHLGLIDGGKSAAMAVAGAALASAGFLRQHLAATAVLAATAGVLMWSPAPHVIELPPTIAAPGPTIAPTPLEPRREPPTLDTGEDTEPDVQLDSPPPDTAMSEVSPPGAVDTEPVTPTDTEPPTEPQPPPRRREPPPRREPEPDEPPDGPPEPRCVEVAVPPVVDLPTCLAKVDKIAP